MIEIIKINKEDKEKIKELSQAAGAIVKEYYDPIIGAEQNDYMIKLFQSPEGIHEQLNNGHTYYAAMEGDKYAGFISYYPKDGKLYLNKYYLSSEMRGKGYGHTLMDFIKDKARENGYPAVFLNVNKYNSDSINIYKHFGFEIIRAEKNPIGNGFYMDDYVMEWRV